MVLVRHHTKYKEIHGEDEVILMEAGEHHALHKRLREKGECAIPVNELAEISRAARNRVTKQEMNSIKSSEVYDWREL